MRRDAAHISPRDIGDDQDDDHQPGHVLELGLQTFLITSLALGAWVGLSGFIGFG